tara:strand:- start:24 stop:251 length:228 start_codon:yes stop_codon:yes gene_type:complete
MYYVLSGVLAVLVSLKYTKHVTSKHQAEYEALVEKVELVEKSIADNDTETLKKVMTTVLPIAKAVNRLNNEVGVQ